MADDLRVRVSSDVSDFKEGFEDAGRTVEDFQHKVDGAKKSTVDFGQKGKMSTKDLISEISKMTGAERHLTNYRRQLGQMTKDIQDLTVNYRAMSDEMKNSDVGKATLERINELTKKAGEYKDAVMDAQQSIKVLASDTANWDAAKQGIQALSGALQGIVSVGVLGKKSTDDLIKVIAKLQAVEKGFNGVIAVTNALQKQSALMQGVMRIQTAALTKATTIQTGATVAQTVAQKALNVVAKANPYVLLASAVLAVAAAVGTWLAVSKRNVGVQEDLAEAQENVNKALKDSHLESGKSIAKFQLLASQYKQLKSEAEKQTWINKHRDEFKDLNLAVKDVNDADDLFVRHAKDVVKAMRLRAEAAAIMSQYQEEYAKAYKKSLEIEEGRQSSFMSSSTFRNDWKKAGLTEGDYTHTTATMQSTAGAYSQSIYSLTESGIQKMKDYWKAQGEAAMDSFTAGMAGSIQKAEQLVAEAEKLDAQWHTEGGSNNNGGNKDNPTPDYKNEIKLLEEENARLEDQKLLVEHLSDKWKEYEQQIIANKEKIQELKDEEDAWRHSLEGRQPLELPVLPKLEGRVEYHEQLKLPVRLSPQDLTQAYKDAASKAGEISEWVRLGIIDKDKAYTMIDALNKDLQSKGIKVPVELDVETLGDQINELRGKIEDFADVFTAPIHAINGVKSAFDNLNSVMEDPDADGWDQFFAIFQVGESIVSAVSTAMGILSTVTDLVTAAKTKNTAASVAEATAEGAEAAARGVNTGAAITEAAAVGAVAGSEAASSVASIPFAGPALAIAAIIAVMAAVVAAIASAKGFAEGGVVGGHSYTGDKILARLNSGEIILNQKQQANLLEQLDRDTIISSHDGASINIPDKITLTAHGSDMEAVLTNVLNKKSKI